MDILNNLKERLLSRVYRIYAYLTVGEISKKVQKYKLTYLDRAALRNLEMVVNEIEKRNVKGEIYEAGTALGGSAIVIASNKTRRRKLVLHDVFAQIPEPSERDGDDVHARYVRIKSGEAKGIDGDMYYGYEENLIDKVKMNFERNGIEISSNNIIFKKGTFEDTFYPEGPISMCHLDGDWYDSTYTCLERVWPNMSVGGIIVIDDYLGWSGATKAVDDFLKNKINYKKQFRGRLNIVKY